MPMRTVVIGALAIFMSRIFVGAEVQLLEDFLTVLQIPTDIPSKVFRMDMDVTKDGAPELFLGTSYLGGAFGQSWVVYTPDSDGIYRKLGTLAFHYEGFYYSTDESRFSVYVRIGSQTGGFRRYRVNSEGFQELTEPFGSLEEEKKKVEAWKKEDRPRRYSVYLKELRESASPVWRDSLSGEINPALGKLEGEVIE